MNEKLKNEIDLLEDMKVINLKEEMIEEINAAKLKIMIKYLNIVILAHNSIDENAFLNRRDLDWDFLISELELELQFSNQE